MKILSPLAMEVDIDNKHKRNQLLDIYILMLLFQIMPIAHKSKGTKKNMKIVNPQAVDFDAYQKKVEAARVKYVV